MKRVFLWLLISGLLVSVNCLADSADGAALFQSKTRCAMGLTGPPTPPCEQVGARVKYIRELGR